MVGIELRRAIAERLEHGKIERTVGLAQLAANGEHEQNRVLGHRAVDAPAQSPEFDARAGAGRDIDIARIDTEFLHQFEIGGHGEIIGAKIQSFGHNGVGVGKNRAHGRLVLDHVDGRWTDGRRPFSHGVEPAIGIGHVE